MNKRTKQGKGITLISLVITIIVMLILAGVSIAMLLGENGLLAKAQKAKEETQIKKYEEIINLAITEAYIRKEETSDLEILTEVKEILLNDVEFKEATISGPDENEEKIKLIIKTKEGYIYYIYGEKVEYKGKEEEIGEIELDIEIEKGDIKYTYEPTNWTNGEVEVKIEIEKEEYKNYQIQYSYDGQNWINYKQEIKVTENNTTIIARLTNGIATTGEDKYATGNITNIDRLKPNEYTPEATSTTNSITIKAETTDQEATEKDGKSGIEGYRFKLNEEEWTEYQESGTYTWNNLAQTTNYTITVEAKDKAGNTTQETTNKETGEVPGLTTANITFEYSTTNWTNGNVTATASTTIEGYTLRTSTDGKTWSSTASQTFTTNGTIYAILWDGTNYGESAAGNITNIDKTVPTISTTLSSSNVTTNGFTLNIGVTDTNSGLSNIVWNYKLSTASTYTSVTDTYTTMNGSTAGTTTAVTKTKTITNLTSGTYNAYAEIYDVAGNKTTSSTINITTGTVPSGVTSGIITFSTPTWTSGKASTTISTNTTGYTIQYQVNSTTGTWTTGTSVTGLLHGDIVYARLWDGTNAGEYATQNILDSTAPTAPTLTVTSGTEGTNNWYTSNVVVKITAGTDSQSGVSKVTYTLSGATTKTETTITSGNTITISAEGTTTITAYTYDVAGNKSSATLTINKDATAPTITLTQTNTTTLQETKTVNVSISDTSGTSALKWAYGSRSVSYFTSSGTSFSSSFSLTMQQYFTGMGGSSYFDFTNIVCTVYAIDEAGNSAVETIAITNLAVNVIFNRNYWFKSHFWWLH